MRRWVKGLRGLLVMSVSALVLLGPALALAAPVDGEVRAQLGKLRVPFIANQGQADAQVAYYAPTFAGTVFVTGQGELVYALRGRSSSDTPRTKAQASVGPGWSLTETLLDGRPRPVGQDRSATGISYFIGDDPTRWRPEVATYDQLSLGEVWPGVTVSLRAHGRSIEKVFTVRPGASVDRIRVRVAGADTLAVDPEGALVVGTGLGAVTFTAPVAYQERGGVRHPVAVGYRRQGREYGFTVGAYDSGLPLVIDPILQSTFLGGSGVDSATGLAINTTTGDVYVAGFTSSTDFPGTLGGAQPASGGGQDAFVARLNSTLTALIRATYLGGSGVDTANAIAFNSNNGVFYVAGSTTSTNFPGTAGGAQIANAGGQDAFVVALDPTLTVLLNATYLGGSGLDSATALAMSGGGTVYVAGFTSSTNFFNTTGAFGTNAGGEDAFVGFLPQSLVGFTSTYLGGTSLDRAFAIAIHLASGDVYVAGVTVSTDFAGPTGTTGAAQPAIAPQPPLPNPGIEDAFVARFPSTLATLTKATYLGGTAFDIALGLAINQTSGDVYVAGFTASADFPLGGGPQAQSTFSGGLYDAFIARLTANLLTLTNATYLGGSFLDGATALAINQTSGDVYVAGSTNSNNFPGTTGGAQPLLASPVVNDGFVARLPNTLASVTQATFLGGTLADGVNALVLAPGGSGDVYVAGNTLSTNFPGTPGGAQPAIAAGANDAFVARLTFDLLLNLAYTLGNSGDITVAQGSGGSNTITATLVSGTPQPLLFNVIGLPTGAAVSFTPGPCTPSCFTTLTITTTSAAGFPIPATPPGTYPITVNGSLTNATTMFNLIVTAGSFSYTLTNSGNITVGQGASGNNTITATLQTGTTTPVSFAATGLPGGATAGFAAGSCSPTCSSTLTITTTGATPTGTFPITVTGSPLNITTVFNLVVNPVTFAYTLANSGNITVTRGTSGATTITATLLSGTTTPVSFAASGLPGGTTAAFAPGSCSPTCSSTLTITSTAIALLGTVPITVTGSPLNVTTTFNLTVLPAVFIYTLANSGSIVVAQGASGTTTITATLQTGTTTPVSFAVAGLPGGATAAFTPGTCSPTCSSTLTITATGIALLGTFQITVTGSPLNVTTTFNLTVTTPPPFLYALANSGNITVPRGASGTTTITATLITGSTTPVSLAIAGIPGGATAAFTPGSCSPTCSSTLTITATGIAVLGTFPITVTASPLNLTTTFNLTVTPPLILTAAANQTTFTVGQTVTITLGLTNPGLPLMAEVYLGTVRPNGSLEFLTPTGVVVGTLADLRPAVTGFSLATPFTVTAPNLFPHTFTSGDQHGPYTFFFAITSGGQLLGVATAPYAFP